MTITGTSSSSSLSTIPTAQLGGVRKKNGHKESCKCPICMNMKHDKKKGGYMDVDMEEEEEEIMTNTQSAGKKRKGNGHKKNCGCPICKNMRKHNKKGGDIEDQTGDIENQKDNVEDVEEDIDVEEKTPVPAVDEEYDELVAAEEGNAGLNVVGGKRRHKKHSTHKKRKTSRRSRKMRRTRRHRRHSRRH
jgi:hypothetical protein